MKTNASHSPRLPQLPSWRSAVLFLLFLFPALAVTRAADSVESLRFRLSAERQALDVPQEELDSQYGKALERLRDEATKEGDLAKRLLVDGEIKFHAGETETRPDPGKHPQLAAMRKIYDDRKSGLLAQSDARREKLLVEYAAAFAALQKSLTVEDKIDEAVEARDVAASLEAELERLRRARKTPAKAPSPTPGTPEEFSWQEAFAGTLVEPSPSGVALRGATTAGLLGAVVAKERLPRSFTVRGQIKINGPWPGILLGFDSEDKPFAYAYADGEGTQIETWHQKQRVKTTRLDLKWERDSWESFEVTRNGREWSIKLGGKAHPVPLPEEIRGDRFGFMAFGPGTVDVRRLTLSAK